MQCSIALMPRHEQARESALRAQHRTGKPRCIDQDRRAIEEYNP